MTKVFKVLLFAITLAAIILTTAQASTPELPATLHGTLLINGQPAQIGTTLYAEATNIQPVIGGNPFTVEETGIYSISITGVTKNTEVRFYIIVAGNRFYANETYRFGSSGSITAKNLTIIAAVRVAGVTVVPEMVTINVGATQQFSATVAPANATNLAVNWSSNNETVATVNANGLVTGMGAGTATITATTVDGGFIDTSIVTVIAPTPPPVPTVAVIPPTVTPVVVEQPIVAGQITEVVLTDVLKVTVTAGAIVGEAPMITAQVMTPTEAAAYIAAATGIGLNPASEIVVLTMTGGEFTAPVELSLNYDPAQIATGKVPSVFVYNERTGRWIFIGGQVINNTITVSVNRFSKFAVFATSPLPVFHDIVDHWARRSIKTMAGMGIVSGYPDASFRPDIGITRAEFVSMLTRALGLRAKPEAANRFTDVKDWARGAIGAAVEAGLIVGYEDSTFRGSRMITRAETSVIMERVVRKDLVPVIKAVETSFADAGVFPAWAADGIRTASKAGLVRGFPDRTFRPGSTTTRAEALTMLYRLIAER